MNRKYKILSRTSLTSRPGFTELYFRFASDDGTFRGAKGDVVVAQGSEEEEDKEADEKIAKGEWERDTNEGYK